MKKITSSIVAALAMSTFAYSGGDIAPVQPAVEVPEVVSTPGSFYLGIAYAYMNSDVDATGTATFTPDGSTTAPQVADTTTSAEADWNAIMLQAGYQFNPYLAIEGRYWTNVGTGDGDFTETVGTQTGSGSGDADDIDAWGIYVKPTLPVGESFNIYALLGYGNVSTAALDDSGFQWGAGASYSISDNLSLFVDYVSLYDDSYNDTYSIVTTTPVAGTVVYDDNIDQSVYSVNFGVTYKF